MVIDLSRKTVYRFDDVEVDVPRGCVRRAEQEVYLRQQTFQVLLYLIRRRERLVTKEELFENIWKDAAVTDNALLQCIFDIRKTLGDDSRNPRFIKTFPKVGYRFISAVEEVFPDEKSDRDVERGQRQLAEPVEHPEKAAGADSPIKSTAVRAAIVQSKKFWLVAITLTTLVVAVVVALYVRSRTMSRQMPAEVVLPQVSGKQPLAVMYFDNQSGNSELDWLREGLADMLITGLSRSSNLIVLSRQQLHLLLERIDYKEPNKIRLDEALQVARSARAELVIMGSFAQLGSQIRIDVQLHKVRDGQLLVAERLVVDQPAQILTQADLLSLKIASHLGAATSGPETKAELTSVMTNNLEAYRYYSLGVEKAQALHTQEATDLLKKAIALDPQFAMAHARIGYAYGVTSSEINKAKPYLEKAFKLSERLTAKDRLQISAWYAIANLDFSSAIAAFREIVSRYPLEVEAYWRLSQLLRGEEKFDEAIEIAKQGLVIDPNDKNLYNSLGGCYVELARHDEALAMFQRYLQLAPNEPNAYDSIGLSHQWAGRYDEATQAFQRALTLNPQFEVAVVHLGNTYFQEGRYRDALNVYENYLRLAGSDFDRVRAYNTIALLHLRLGKLKEAEAATKNSMRLLKDSVSVSFLVALARNDIQTATRYWQILDQRNYLARGARGYIREIHYLRGRFAEKTGRSGEAIEAYKEALRHRPLVWHLDAYEDCLANALLDLGRYDEAIAEYNRILRLNPQYPLVQYHLAQAYERKGLREQAQAAYQQFLKDWKDADADVPEVITAKEKVKL